MTDAAPWEPRAGAATVVQGDRLLLLGGEAGFVCDPLPDCEPMGDQIVCFGGFGLEVNPNDMWASPDGAEWTDQQDGYLRLHRPGELPKGRQRRVGLRAPELSRSDVS